MNYKNFLAITLVLVMVFFITTLVLFIKYVPAQARVLFGPPNPELDFAQQLLYSVRLLMMQDQLLADKHSDGQGLYFEIQNGETAEQVSQKLKERGLIENPEAFIILLKYAGLDTRIRAGNYSIESGMNALRIVQQICDRTPDRVKFVILPGMRAEEIAALLPTSGLKFSPDEFLDNVRNPQTQKLPPLLANVKSLEGFLYPAEYEFSREISLEEFLKVIVERFASQITPEMLTGWQNNQLTPDQGVILASMIQREVVLPQEAPYISSVFINRLQAGMKLESDATIQYVVGKAENNWWKGHLTSQDFETVSDFNTYQKKGLPPAAICNPGSDSLRASALPAKTEFLFFQSRCDKSGGHQFFATYAEQFANLCPQP